ncbi:MAG: FHA domain-containing protein [Anaerolineae bacterium]|nr:FHA domain-containing protein [Anaerolineae bacterium]
MSHGGWRLTIQKGPNRGQSYSLHGSTVTLGRHQDNQVVINDSMVSRHHARLEWQGQGYVVHDLGSANGTWVNGRRIQGPARLSPGDTLGLSPDIVLSFGPASPGISPTRIADDYLAAESSRPPSSRTWLWVGIGGTLALVAIAAVVLALSGALGNGQSDPTPGAVTATAAEGVAFVTATPQPTSAPADAPTPTVQATAPAGDLSVPTLQPTYTPYPTYTPFPTVTPADTPTHTPQPTYTTYPTYTPYPTQKPPPTSAPAPTNTTQPPQPTATSRPPFTVSINKIDFEPWGRPTNPDGCNGPYNDRDPVKRFTIELIVTNQTNRTMESGWLPVFYTAREQIPETCIWVYDNMSIQPGETAYVTFVTHVEYDDWVQIMALGDENYQVFICFNAAAQVVPCQ